MGAGEGRVETYGQLEEVASLLVVGAVEAVHVPEAAMMRLPRIQRARRLQDGTVALAGFDLAGDRGDDAVADRIEDEKSVVERLVSTSDQRMRAVPVSTSSTITVRRRSCRRTVPPTT